MADPKLPMHGENVPVTVFIDNVPYPQADNAISIEIEPVMKEHNYELLGQSRDVLDQQLRGWRGKVMFQHTDNVLFKAWLVVQEAREARTRIPEIMIAPSWEMRDGTTETWALQRCELVPTKNVGGATEDAKLSWSFKAVDYEQVF
jgi:hypothetical protein